MSKKTETIEVRMSPELKAELSEVCKDRNQSISKLIRDLVQTEISDFAQETTQSGVRRMAKSGTRRLREFGLAGVSLVALGLGWMIVSQTPVEAQAMVRVTFAEIDRNEDGVITRDEYRTFVEDDIAFEIELVGDDGDDEVPAACEAEFSEFAEFEDEDLSRMIAEDFTTYDSDSDGKVVYDELRTAMIRERAQEFARLDSDADGSLVRAEFNAIITDLPDEDDPLSAACVQALEALDAEALAVEAYELKLAFVAMDENRDDRLSREEYLNN